MPTNHTEHYSLSQWEAEDKVLRTDFNEDNAKIDAALAELAGKIPAKNLLAYNTSYSGNGPTSSASKRTITLPGKPMMVMIQGSNRMYFGFRGTGVLFCPFLSDGYGSVSWSNDSITLSGANGDKGANQSGFSYSLFALLEA